MGLHDSITELERLRKKTNWDAVALVGGLALFSTAWIIPHYQIIPIICGIGLVIYGVKHFDKSKKEFKSRYKELFVEAPLRNNFDNVIYNWETGFNQNQVQSFGICSMGNRFRSEDYIMASYHGVRFEISDVYVAYHSGGKNSHTTVYFKGRMMVFEFPEKLVNSVRIYSNNFKYRAGGFIANHKNKVEMESVNFNRTFDVMSSSDHDAFYLLTPQFMEKIYQLYVRHNSLAVHISGNYVLVGFNEPYNDAFDVKDMKKNISYPEEMDKINRDINDIKEIIDIVRDLNQGNDYYTIL